MRTQIRKCPGGVTILVPDALVELAGLSKKLVAELEMQDGQIVIRPTEPQTLSDLLSAITTENQHGEWDTGGPVGEEVI